jgi:predicted DNA-binding protein (MmcQ/YjbR family)
MNIEEVREYCISKKGVTESLPFGDDTLVFKVGNKMFALANLEGELRINLKNDPEKNVELREEFPSIIPGYHMNKVHWNTVIMNGSLSSTMVLELIDESYEIILKSLPKKTQLELINL